MSTYSLGKRENIPGNNDTMPTVCGTVSTPSVSITVMSCASIEKLYAARQALLINLNLYRFIGSTLTTDSATETFEPGSRPRPFIRCEAGYLRTAVRFEIVVDAMHFTRRSAAPLGRVDET